MQDVYSQKGSLMNVAIIGAGFCGLAVAWHLLNHAPRFPSLKISLFDSKGIGKGTSAISAGLLHPYAGAHAKLNWRGYEGLQATKDLLHKASLAIGRPVTAQNQGILRLALTQQQEADFQLCAQRYPQDTQWLNAAECQSLLPGCAEAPGLWLKQGITVYSSLYLQGLWNACKNEILFEQRAIHSLTELQDFDLTIITAGAESLQISELSNLPLKIVKGQVLEFAWPEYWEPLSCALNSHAYILMTENKTTCLAGATYERDFSDGNSNILRAKKEIFPKACELFPQLQQTSIINCYAGMRAVASQHHPFIQRLSPSQWILTGMGSKGLLYHALFARELVQTIWNTVNNL